MNLSAILSLLFDDSFLEKILHSTASNIEPFAQAQAGIGRTFFAISTISISISSC